MAMGQIGSADADYANDEIVVGGLCVELRIFVLHNNV